MSTMITPGATRSQTDAVDRLFGAAPAGTTFRRTGDEPVSFVAALASAGQAFVRPEAADRPPLSGHGVSREHANADGTPALPDENTPQAPSGGPIRSDAPVIQPPVTVDVVGAERADAAEPQAAEPLAADPNADTEALVPSALAAPSAAVSTPTLSTPPLSTPAPLAAPAGRPSIEPPFPTGEAPATVAPAVIGSISTSPEPVPAEWAPPASTASAPTASLAAVSTPAVRASPASVPSPSEDAPATAALPPVGPSAPAPAAAAATAAAHAPAAPPRTVATQLAPTVISIVQRPVGSHQVTMTVSPDTLGPVTVRAHIGASGDVRVELVGATDAGRDALRAIVTDLRRDLAAAMPHATLSLAAHTAPDPGGDRGTASSTGGPGGGAASGSPHGSSGGSPGDAASDRRTALGTHSARPAPAPTSATPPVALTSAGLDTFA